MLSRAKLGWVFTAVRKAENKVIFFKMIFHYEHVMEFYKPIFLSLHQLLIDNSVFITDIGLKNR